MIKYVARTYTINRIEKVEIIKESASTVTFLAGGMTQKTRRESKESRSHIYASTWDEAHAFLVSWAQQNIEAIEKQREYSEKQLAEIKGMKNEMVD
jgi:hypothetical protein